MSKKLSLLVLILTMQTYCFAKEYVVYELIPLEYSQDYPDNYGIDLNNNGLVAGWASAYYCEDGEFPAFYGTDSYNIIDIGDQSYGMAWGINDNNQAVGYVSDLPRCDFSRKPNLIACIFNNDANGYIPLWNDGSALAINNLGNITGYIKNTSTGNREPVLYGPETGYDTLLLGSLPGYINGEGQSINEQNIIVANYHDSDYASQQAVIIQPYSCDIIKLDDLGGGQSGAARINDNNQIVGSSSTESQKQHAVLYNTNNIDDCNDCNDNQEIIDLGILDGFSESCAVGINNKGQVVGYSYNEPYPLEPAVGTIFDTTGNGNNININDILINGDGWIVRELVNINEDGWILARAKHKTIHGHSVLLKPVICKGELQGDVNKDCRVDFTDFALMTSNWLECNFADPNYCD